MIGQTVSCYRILRQLGKGGMGVVFLAEDTRLGRKVAVKVLNVESDGQHPRQRFMREARAISSFTHPNIVAVHDCGEMPDGRPFIVMEFIEGETLAELLGKCTLTLSRTLEIVEDIGKAVAEAHRHKIIHRDIKPSNVMVDENGVAKVLDFGLAKSADGASPPEGATSEARALVATRTREGTFIGTPQYVSPEQALAVPLDARSDLFSLGSVLYECLSGRPAFSGTSEADICAKVIRDDPPPPSQFCAEVPPELDRVTLRLLAKKPEARYQSAQEFLADLGRLKETLDGGGGGARVAPAPAARREARTSLIMAVSAGLRRPRTKLAVFLAAFVLALAAVWALSSRSHGRVEGLGKLTPAERWYRRGTEALHNGSYFSASKMLEASIKEKGDFPLAHLRLAEALSEMDYTDRAKDEVIRVGQLVPDRTRLPAHDALSIEAITNTIAGDFNSAVAGNRKLAEDATGSEKAAALVDLGRAYEKADDLKDAARSYEEASKADAQYAAAFLRLGVARGRQQDSQGAGAAFDRAQGLYEMLGDLEGLTQVFYERGSMLLRLRKIPEAREQLSLAVEKSRAAENRSQQVLALLRMSTVRLFEGDVTGAQQLASDALTLAQSNDMENLAAGGLIDLGNGFFAKGMYADAERYFKQSLDIARRNKGRRGEARALLALGSLYTSSGRASEAVGNAEKALEFYRQGGYRREVLQALNVLAHAHDQTGDYASAYANFGDMLEEAERSGDQAQAAAAHEGFGLALIHQELYTEALPHLRQKYEINKSLGNRLYEARGLMQMALALWPVGRFEEARDFVRQASEIASQSTDKSYVELQTWLALVNARMALSEGRATDAVRESTRAIELAGGDNREVSVEAKYALGLALAESGSPREGLKCSEEAVGLAEGMGDPHYLTGALLALSEASLASGDARGARGAALRAQTLSYKSGMQESEWRAWALAASASRRLSGAEAGAYVARARVVLTNMERRWGADASAGYLSRRDVQNYRRSLEQER